MPGYAPRVTTVDEESTGGVHRPSLARRRRAGEPGFRAEITAMIDHFPGCGNTVIAFNIVSDDGFYPAPTPAARQVARREFFQVTRPTSIVIAICSLKVSAAAR